MTTPDIAGLCERLRGVESETYALGFLHVTYVNPDGPEAADTLERQAAEIERLRTGLEKVAAYYGTGHRVTEIARAALTGEDTATLSLPDKTQTDANIKEIAAQLQQYAASTLKP
jgi:hypothetical protein